MAEIIETPRARMVRLLNAVGQDDKVALAAVQGLTDLLVAKSIVTQEEFYEAVSNRLEDL